MFFVGALVGVILVFLSFIIGVVILLSILQGVGKEMSDLKSRYFYILAIDLGLLFYMVNSWQSNGSQKAAIYGLIISNIIAFYGTYRYTKDWT